jgi:hypothetical protein
MKKRHHLSIGSLILAALLTTACERKAVAPAQLTHPEFQAALDQVLQGQSQMQQSLSQNDLEKTKTAFQSLHAVLHMMPVEGLDSEKQAYWDSANTEIMAILHPLAAAKDIDSAKAYVKTFGALLDQVVRRFGEQSNTPPNHPSRKERPTPHHAH